MGANEKSVVLVADDDPDDVLLLKQAFQRAGMTSTLHHCLNGAEAISYLKGEGEFADREKFPFPRLLLTDLKMPVCSGYELLQWQRENSSHRVFPTIVLSGSAEDIDVKRAFELGAHSYFQKPRAFDDLVRLVRLSHEYWTTSLVPSPPTGL